MKSSFNRSVLMDDPRTANAKVLLELRAQKEREDRWVRKAHKAHKARQDPWVTLVSMGCRVFQECKVYLAQKEIEAPKVILGLP